MKELPGNNSRFFYHRQTMPESGEIRFTDTILFCLILQGNGQIQYQKKSILIHTGDFLFFPQNALFMLLHCENLLIYEISFLPYFFDTLEPEYKSADFRHFHIRENEEDSRTNDIYHHIGLFVDSWNHTPEPHSLQIVSALGNLFTTVSKYFLAAGPLAKQPDGYREERIRLIIQYITAHYTERITVSQISHAIGLNPQYFSAFFSRCFHKTFIEYLNQYRISKSVSSLRHPDLSITQIAYDHGFQTYRSYSNAFRKIFHQSPSQYREVIHDIQDSKRNEYAFLSKYRYSFSPLPQSENPAASVQLDLDLIHTPALQTDRRYHGISIGSGYQLLQDNVYTHLQKAARECRFTHVYFRDVFSDLLNVYTEPVPDQPLFTWEYVDDVIKRILGLQMRPFIELGFMPRELAATKETLGYGYHPCIGRPKSLFLWQQMIRSFLEHCIREYGTAEMNSWFFDFWDSANIRSSDGYWNDSKQEFFKLYQATYLAFQEFSLEHLLGSPSFSLPGGLDWYEDFLQFCRKEDIHPGALSTHLYSCSDQLADFSGIFPYTPTNYNYLSLTDTDMITNNIEKLTFLLHKYGFQDLAIITGEWNITFYLSDLVRDTAFMATYVVHTWIRTLSLVSELTFSCLSDISELSRPSVLAFPGSQGLISRSGLAKPAYNAFFLLHKLDRHILWNEYPCLITKGADICHILLYNISNYEKDTDNHPEILLDDYRYQVFQDTGSIYFRGEFAFPSGSCEITTYRIDREHGSAYDAWLRMGSPDPMTPEISDALIHSSYPELHFEKVHIRKTLKIDVTIQPHSVILYEIRMKP